MQGVEAPAVVSFGQSLIVRISQVANSARDALVEQEGFIQLACYLERILPIAIELQRGRDSSPMVCEILDALMRDVECANNLIHVCSNKSRIYLLTRCMSVAKQIENVVHDLGRSLSLIPLSSVQGHEDTKRVIDSLARDMQQARFEVNERDERICQLLQDEDGDIRNDPSLQTGLLLDIACSVGIEDARGNPSALKHQVELLRNDLQGTTEVYDLQLMDLLGNMVNNLVRSRDETNQSDEGIRQREFRRVEPLYESFVCPLTKQVMRDPVTLENGQPYERSAIERWFKECQENGRHPVCPMTGKELETTILTPSIALRNTIEEWTARNEGSRIENARILLEADSSEQDMLHGLKDLQVLCLKNKFNKHRVQTVGLMPVIVDCLTKGQHVRCTALATLRILAEDDDDNKEAIGETDAIKSCVKCLSRELSKEREEAISLLYELSKSYPLCEKIGKVNGAILMLVGTVSSTSDNVLAVERADKTLENLEKCEQNVKQMLEYGRVQPLLKRLVEGEEEVRLKMACHLSEVALTKEGKETVAEFGAKTLVEMLESNYLAGREAALKALCQLSSLDRNGKILVEAGILPPLIRDLFVVGVNQLPLKLKEVSATVLANVVSSGVDTQMLPIDAEGNTLTSEVIIHNLLHLVSNTGPAIEAKLLQVLVGLASSPRTVGNVVSAIRSAGATISVIQFLEAPQKELRVNSVKLLYCLCSHMDQELADGLRVTTGQLGTLVKIVGSSGITEEQAAAAGLLANLPTLDFSLTHALLEEGTLPIVVKQIEELRKGVVRIGAGRFFGALKEALVGILSRFTYVLDDAGMMSLAKEYNLTSLFTSLLNTREPDEVLRQSALALENLSAYSKQLSDMPKAAKKDGFCSRLFQCFRPPPKPVGLCHVHGGFCSAKSTFCLLEAKAIEPLVTCLDYDNVGLVEAALGALSTLLQDSGDVDGGVQILSSSGAIEPILHIMREHRTEALQQQAVWIVERILRNGDLARFIAADANVDTALVEAFRHGNYSTKQMAEKALKHLNKIPNFSGAFYKGK